MWNSSLQVYFSRNRISSNSPNKQFEALWVLGLPQLRPICLGLIIAGGMIKGNFMDGFDRKNTFGIR